MELDYLKKVRQEDLKKIELQKLKLIKYDNVILKQDSINAKVKAIMEMNTHVNNEVQSELQKKEDVAKAYKRQRDITAITAIVIIVLLIL